MEETGGSCVVIANIMFWVQKRMLGTRQCLEVVVEGLKSRKELGLFLRGDKDPYSESFFFFRFVLVKMS